ncbi:uncharacterized protein PHACADRAFT_259662 [Phanerochaete carnosa HHB-10118-sp]|uniref:Cytochrome P450 n=1 Tax=Phanerochaete carnosa (strain HHB-10118-sp) TaxID=650164 RepID=K5W2M6_PHACS|nr:uncharacterized protein PHACADRAFT_259662 [Phanerochaete carnosa HHB-10118-sp]EKM53350.1 hypothetical protein PHACADRAFT_259662 [Phanerochaete carnosa HHB-10118-sp]
MANTIAIAVILVVALLWSLRRRLTKISMSDVPGPKPESFWLGNLRHLFLQQAGEGDFELQEQYGGIARVHTSLGGESLWISDPKALQYIYVTSGYRFIKPPDRRALSRLHSGHGLLWAEGEVHKRQRKVMLPAFQAPEMKALFPHFTRAAEAMSVRWKDLLTTSTGQSAEIDIPAWLSQATLNAVGEAAFDYHFGTLEDPENDLVRAYNNFTLLAFRFASAKDIFKVDIMRLFSYRVIKWIQDHQNNPAMEKARECERLTLKVAKELVDTKAEALKQGKGSKDVFSLLVKANVAEDAKSRLSDEEMYAEMRTILFAGHETTSSTIGWALLELARHPKAQTRLRQEIIGKRSTRGGAGLTAADAESMPYLQAVLREVLRVHPIISQTFRVAVRDDVLPLSKPLTTKSGKVLEKLPIPKGARVILSVAAYNRDPDLWGSDPHSFDPERWLDGRVKKGQALGMFGNLLTFAAGLRACIGWRFAVYEIQAFLIELIQNFEFVPTEDMKRLRRELFGIMAPTLEGDRGNIHLPIRVSLVDHEA